MKTNIMLTAPAIVCGLGLLATGAPAVAQNSQGQDNNFQGEFRPIFLRPLVHHVLLISVDGLHQSDLAWYVQTHPQSTLGTLAARGVDYLQAFTPFPSDSFPGMVGQVTGGNPSSTGVYYDDSWNHSLFPAGTTSCAGPAPGAEVTYFEALDLNLAALDAGQGIVPAPGPDPWANILQMTSNPLNVIDPKQLPVNP